MSVSDCLFRKAKVSLVYIFSRRWLRAKDCATDAFFFARWYGLALGVNLAEVSYFPVVSGVCGRSRGNDMGLCSFYGERLVRCMGNEDIYSTRRQWHPRPNFMLRDVDTRY